MDSVIKYLKGIIDLPQTEEHKFLQIARQKNLVKEEQFIREGQVPRKLAFVHKGLFRYYYVNNKGTEFTKNFISETNFIAAYSAMIAGKPSAMFIEALEGSMIYEINYTDWVELRKGNRCWNELLVCMLEKGFSIKEKREREFLLLDAEERYKIFKQEFPGLEARVKQHLIASYLGISPVSLSRIRKKAGLLT